MISRKGVLCAATAGFMFFASVAMGQQSTTPPPTVPDGWTEQEAIQWLLPGQEVPEGGGMDQVDISKIRFMGGKKLDCKNMVGGLLKCCKATVPDQQQAWWGEYAKTQKQSNATDMSSLIDHVSGAWDKMDAGADHWDLNETFTSDYESLTGGGKEPDSQAKGGNMADVNNNFMADQKKNTLPKLSWYCDTSDFEVAVQKNTGQCHYIGSKCQSKVLGVCLVKKELYCCFNSPITRIMREDMLKRGIGDMGTAKAPNCAGLSVQDMMGGGSGIDQMDTTEAIGRMQMGGFLPNDVMDPKAAESLYTGAGSSYGDPSRLVVSKRTDARLNSMDYEGATDSLEASLATTLPSDTTDEPNGPGEITFTTGYYAFDSGHPAVLALTRNGGVGMVSVVVATLPGTAMDGRDYAGVSQTVYWSQGELGSKSVTVPTTAFTGPSKRTFKVMIGSPTGGAVVTPYNNVDVELRPSED